MSKLPILHYLIPTFTIREPHWTQTQAEEDRQRQQTRANEQRQRRAERNIRLQKAKWER
jgi:hypothetical protein